MRRECGEISTRPSRPPDLHQRKWIMIYVVCRMPTLRKDKGDGQLTAAVEPPPTTSQQQRPSCTIADGHRRRIVVVRPSSSIKTNYEAGIIDDDLISGGRQQRRWPHYERCCRTYGFSVDVDQIFMPYNNASSCRVSDDVVVEGGGPRVHSFLVTPSTNNDQDMGVNRSPLRFMGERIVVRISPPTSSDTVIDGESQHVNVNNGDLVDGDVIMTLDGETNPTFAKLYELMCLNEKLVLEVMSTVTSPDEKKSEVGHVNKFRVDVGSGNDGDVGDRDEVVGLLNTKKPNVMTNDRTTTTSTLTNKSIDTTFPILPSSNENTNNDEITSNNDKSTNKTVITAAIKSPMKPKLPEGATECTYACLEIGEGWTQQLVTQVEGGRKFRSLVEVNRYLNRKCGDNSNNTNMKGAATTNLEKITPPESVTNDINSHTPMASLIQDDNNDPSETNEKLVGKVVPVKMSITDTTTMDSAEFDGTNTTLSKNRGKRKTSRWGPKTVLTDYVVFNGLCHEASVAVLPSNCENAWEDCDQSIDDKYELELFDMVEVQLAEALLSSNSDDVSDRERLHSSDSDVVQQRVASLDKLNDDVAMLEDEINFVKNDMEQAEERRQFNEADLNRTIRLQEHVDEFAQFDKCMNLLSRDKSSAEIELVSRQLCQIDNNDTAAEDGQTNTSEDSCCSKSFAVTATTASRSTPPSLYSDDEVNFNSSSPAPEFFDSANGNDDASSTSASSSVASSSSDSSCSSTLSQVPIRRAGQASKDSNAIVRPITDIQTVSRSSSKLVQQPVKSLAVNHLPQKRPPLVISSSRVRLTPAAPIAPTSLSRLWPDPSDIVKALTRWTPPSARVRTNCKDNGINKQLNIEFYGPIRCMSINKSQKGSEVNPVLQTRCAADKTIDIVPREFKDVNDMMETMAPLLLNEGMASLNGDYQRERRGFDSWHRDLYRLRLTKLTEVTPIFKSVSYFDVNGIKMYEAQFSSIGDTNIPPSNLSELYCMHFDGWVDTKFGIVAHDFPTTFSFRTYNESNAFLRLWLVVHENVHQTKQTGWLSKVDFKKLLDPHKNGLVIRDEIILTLMSCGSTTNVVRQFEAIQSLPFLSLHLQKAVFTSFTAKTSKSTTTTKPRSLPLDIWRHLTNSHNTLQLKSISNVLTGSCRENVCLIQGPPGTGKSSTIVGLISALLSGKAPRPKQRQSGCLVHAGKTMGVSNEEPQARNRILVCAATNVAVDSLAWKIKHGSVGPSGKIGDFNLARYGSLPWENSRDSIHQKPKAMSDMEAFLFEVNVNRRASDETQDFEYDDEERDSGPSWSPKKQQHDRKKRRRIVSRASVKLQILGSCSVILTTLSGAGSKAFIDAVCRDPTRNDSEFDAVIIDEACQASEPESLIPFKFNPNTVTLVGDPKQLPVLTLSGSSSNNAFEQSLFERLQSLNHPTILLRTQYRMHEDIAAFPSDQFYDGKLKTPDSVKERPTPFWSCPCFPTICFWDINRRNMSSAINGRGFSNGDEASFISQTILSSFVQNFTNRSDIVTVGIISFYNDQVKLLKEQLSRVPDLDKLNIKVSTVDGFQGDECDIIVLSCVRSHSSFTRGKHHKSRGGVGRSTVGFLEDCRRVNVAMTRAKFSLWIVGNEEVLKTSELWFKLLQEIYQRGMLRRADEFTDIFSRWKASNQLCLEC